MKGFYKLSRFMAYRQRSVRSLYASTLLEDFFVAAIASVLAIRLYLHVTGYPRIAIGGFHISHVMFGGVLMLIALLIFMAFLNRSAKELAAVIGGIGFGAFIDELGKFITSDNDYFYEPAIALIYIAFVLLFFFIRAITSREALSQEECFANAFEIAKQATMTGLDSEERQLALGLLKECPVDDITTQNLKAILLHTAPAHPANHSPLLTRLKEKIYQFYEYMATKWWFTGAIIGFFALVSITSLSTLVALVQWSWALALWVSAGVLILAALFWSRRTRIRYLNVLVSVAIVAVSILMTWAILGSLKQAPLSLVDWAQLVFPSIAGVIVVIGLLLIPVSRLRAYRMFRRAILVSIFFTQVLAFYEYQFLALVGILIDIVILLALRYMVSNEQAKSEAASKIE
ncbi:MAG: hypothetical protein V1932_05065 [Chloroflexota bacterium]